MVKFQAELQEPLLTEVWNSVLSQRLNNRFGPEPSRAQSALPLSWFCGSAFCAPRLIINILIGTSACEVDEERKEREAPQEKVAPQDRPILSRRGKLAFVVSLLRLAFLLANARCTASQNAYQTERA